MSALRARPTFQAGPESLHSDTPLIGLSPLMRTAYAGGDLSPVRTALLERLAENSRDAAAMMDLSTVMQLCGQRDAGLALQAEAIALQPVYLRRYGRGDGLRILAVCTAGDLMANTPLDFLLEGSDFDLRLAFVGAQGRLPDDLPEHNLLLLAIGESPETATVMGRLEAELRAWPRPVFNGHPARIAELTRDGVSALFADDPAVLAPATIRIARSDLAALDPQHPIVVRPVGTHAGAGMEKVENRIELAAWLATQDAAEFYLSPFVDYGGADGLYRKQRIVFIEGRPFISHMAISSHWMVHYLSAGMTTDETKRTEEAEFMAAFDTDFARRHATAFRSLHEKIGLDYFGIDCAETRDGRLLLFEADVAMIVHALDPEPDFSYKQPVMRRLFAAFQQALAGRAA